MKKFLYLILTLLLISCSAWKKEEVNQEIEIVTEKYRNMDSVNVDIKYIEKSVSSIVTEFGSIHLRKQNDDFFFSHSPSDPEMELEYFRGSSKEAIGLLIEFEKKAKYSVPSCAGSSGAPRYLVTLNINDEQTEFAFCKDSYNGIEELVQNFRGLKKEKTNANNG